MFGITPHKLSNGFSVPLSVPASCCSFRSCSWLLSGPHYYNFFNINRTKQPRTGCPAYWDPVGASERWTDEPQTVVLESAKD